MHHYLEQYKNLQQEKSKRMIKSLNLKKGQLFKQLQKTSYVYEFQH